MTTVGNKIYKRLEFQLYEEVSTKGEDVQFKGNRILYQGPILTTCNKIIEAIGIN